MNSDHDLWTKLSLVWGLLLAITACNPATNSTATPTLTSTATPTATSGDSILPSPSPNRCDGLDGQLEMQVLIGPSEVVGLEPLAIGAIPFTVTPGADAYNVAGVGAIFYQEVLEKEWGTYTVEFDLETGIEGSCQGDEQNGILNMTVETSGEQLVEVVAEGYQSKFPWSGSQAFQLSFPIEEGASVTGEGWAFVLHLNE